MDARTPAHAHAARGDAPFVLGRYELHGEIASGGMGSIHIGRQTGAVGFRRLVAVKRLHPPFARSPEFVAMFLDEARLAARVRHPNVVTTVDVVHEQNELFLVMDYIEGESLAGLIKGMGERGERASLPVVSSIVVGLLHGLHAAHEARAEDGSPLGIVHRDISPHNVLVGTDGVARVLDFGIALANVRAQATREGQFKGKLAYIPPEQFTREEPVTPASDVYAAGLVLWELCAGRRAFVEPTEAALLVKVVAASVPRLDEVAPWVSRELADVVHRALERSSARRHASAREMALALERVVPPAPAHEVGDFVERVSGKTVLARRALVAAVERGVVAPAGDLQTATPAGAALGRSDGDTRTDHSLTTDASAGRKRRAWLFRALVACMLAAVAVIAVVRRSPQTPTDGERSGGEPQEAVAASPTPPPAPTAEETAATPEPAATAAPSTSAAAGSPASTATGRAPRPAAQAGAPRAPKPAGPKDRCDPPYYLDESGIRRVKRDCFAR